VSTLREKHNELVPAYVELDLTIMKVKGFSGMRILATIPVEAPYDGKQAARMAHSGLQRTPSGAE